MGCGFLFARGFKSFNCTFELIQFSLRLSTDVSSFGWGLLNHFSCSAPIRNYDIRFTFGSYHFNALCFCLRFGLGYLQLLILRCRLLALNQQHHVGLPVQS